MSNIKEMPLALRIAVEPAMKWLCDNADPYSYILIQPTRAELLSSEQMVATEKYILDDDKAMIDINSGVRDE